MTRPVSIAAAAGCVLSVATLLLGGCATTALNPEPPEPEPDTEGRDRAAGARAAERNAARAVDGLLGVPGTQDASIPAIRTPAPPAGPPVWYDPAIQPEDDDRYFGYGSGASRQEAMTQAKREIAGAMESRIEAELRCDEFDDGTKNRTICRSTATERTSVRLTDVETLRYEHDARSGVHYVKTQFDSAPLGKRIARSLDRQNNPCGPPQPGEAEESPPFLARTVAGRNLERQLGCLPNETALDYTGNGRWSFALANRSFVVVYENEIAGQFWPAGPHADSTALALGIVDEEGRPIPNNEVTSRESDSGGEFFLSTTVADRDGHLTLLSASDTGATLFLHQQPVTAGQHILFPDPQDYYGLKVAPRPGRPSGQELYVAALCPQADRFAGGRFLSIRDEYPDDDDPRLYRFGELVELLDGCHSATRTVLARRGDRGP